MTPEIKEKLTRFIKDEKTANAVKDFILRVYLDSNNSKDVNVLASERLAITLFEEAWKKLSKFKLEENELSTSLKQVGL